MKNRTILILVLIALLCGILFVKNNFYKKPIMVGSDRDSHGCIGSAGYSWCGVKNKCLRIWEENCDATSSPSTQNIQACAKKDGVWYPAENICEVNQLSKNQCEEQKGEFNECASACRHDPKAEVCTMQCVLTCTFR